MSCFCLLCLLECSFNVWVEAFFGLPLDFRRNDIDSVSHATHFSNPSRHRLFAYFSNDKPLELSEESVLQVINEIREELGTIFGYDKKNSEVGITGTIEYIEVDGPEVVVALNGRFWHATDTIMERVEKFITTRIPEVISVRMDETRSTIIDDNRMK